MGGGEERRGGEIISLQRGEEEREEGREKERDITK
jgi:hypothetical protein